MTEYASGHILASLSVGIFSKRYAILPARAKGDAGAGCGKFAFRGASGIN
jgi:hypothetical protein